MSVSLHLGDCLDVMRTLESGGVDAVVCDPPAGIGFMGKAWDSFGGRSNANAEADREANYNGVGKGAQPFGYSGSALPKRGEREAFQAWLAARLSEARRLARPGAVLLCWAIPRTSHWTATAIEDAGWVIEDRIAHLFGTGFPKHQSKLKPACEDWWLARNPGPKWLGVDAGRIGSEMIMSRKDGGYGAMCHDDNWKPPELSAYQPHAGRWPANVALSHHPECNGHCHADCPVRLLDEQSGERQAGHHPAKRNGKSMWAKQGGGLNGNSGPEQWTDTGGASRFMYVSKASRADRNAGCEPMKGDGGVAAMNSHPT